jgi:acetyl-CoA carboxylase biotin carboxyl carrier protein
MDLEEILKLIDAVSERDISELSIEREGICLKIVRQASAAAPVVAHNADPTQVVTQAAPAVATSSVPDTNHHIVTSPIVGTFYSSPGPTAESYVKVGDRVKQGQILCIVEAMKLMNEIESDVSGTVIKLLAENGRPIEYGDDLFSIELD